MATRSGGFVSIILVTMFVCGCFGGSSGIDLPIKYFYYIIISYCIPGGGALFGENTIIVLPIVVVKSKKP